MKIHWIVLIGFVLGLAGGLYYAWTINPVQYYDSIPVQLDARYRRDWVRMTAFAYGYTGDLRRAEVQLQGLPQEEVRPLLVQALDTAVADGYTSIVLTRMASLAKRYGAQSPAVSIYTDSGEASLSSTPGLISTPTDAGPPTPSPTPMPRSPEPTSTPTLDPAQLSIQPTPTPPSPSYVITQVVRSCLPEPRIAVSLTQQVSVTVRGESRLDTQGLAGKEVWLLWSEGADRAITGLRPIQGAGYADFQVEPLETYNLYIDSPTGAPLTDLDVGPCETQEETTWMSWLLVIRSTEIISP